jgi:hypothetical protein
MPDDNKPKRRVPMTTQELIPSIPRPQPAAPDPVDQKPA